MKKIISVTFAIILSGTIHIIAAPCLDTFVYEHELIAAEFESNMENCDGHDFCQILAQEIFLANSALNGMNFVNCVRNGG